VCCVFKSICSSLVLLVVSMAGCVYPLKCAAATHFSRSTILLLLLCTEVWLGSPYNAACDVYSFTLLLWQILTLRQPFSDIVGEESFVQKVIKNNTRPPVKKTLRATLQKVIVDCWSEDMTDRMSMAQVKQQLRDELVRLRRGDDSGLDHERRRSTFIFDQQAHQKSIRDGGILDLSLRSDASRATPPDDHVSAPAASLPALEITSPAAGGDSQTSGKSAPKAAQQPPAAAAPPASGGKSLSSPKQSTSSQKSASSS
jgi:hypothetical protein